MKALFHSGDGKLPIRPGSLRMNNMTPAAASSNQVHTTFSDDDFAEVSMTPNRYELREQPFAAWPDPRFLYMSGTHRLAFASLLRALQANRGMVTLLAQPGLGKTTLLLYTLKSFGDKVATVYLFQPAQSPVDLLQAILTHLGVCAIEETAEGKLRQLRDLLTEEHRLGKRVIVVIDEAQDLHASVFEVLSLLSNLESPRGRLIQFILCGQPMLSDKLAAIKSLQTAQRGMPTAHLEPLSAQDTAQYVDHRLRSAGYGRRLPLFTPEASALVARYSQGSPRSINSLCFEALSIACQDHHEQIGAQTVREAAATLNLAEARLEPREERISVRPSAVCAVPPASVKETRPATAAMPTQAPKVERKPEPASRALLVAEKIAVPPQPPATRALDKPDNLLQLPARELPPPPMLGPVAHLVLQRQIAEPEIAVTSAQPFARPFDTLEEPTVVSAKLEPAQLPTPHSDIAIRPSIARLWRGFSIAAVLLLAVTGAIIGLYRTTTSQPAKQADAAPPQLRLATSARQREQPRTIATVPKAAPTPRSSPGHDLVGMDLQSALRALPGKGQRTQQK